MRARIRAGTTASPRAPPKTPPRPAPRRPQAQHGDDLPGRLVEVALAELRHFQRGGRHRREIGEKLGGRPQHDQQVSRVDRVALALVDPALHHLAGFPRHRLDMPLLARAEKGRPAQQFAGEEARLLAMPAREFQLAGDIIEQRLARVELRVQQAQGGVPVLQHLADQPLVDRRLGREVVIDVRLRQAGGLGDLRDRRAVIALGGKQSDRCVKNQPLIARPYPPLGFVLCNEGSRFFPAFHRFHPCLSPP